MQFVHLLWTYTCTLCQHWNVTVALARNYVLVIGLEVPVDFLPGEISTDPDESIQNPTYYYITGLVRLASQSWLSRLTVHTFMLFTFFTVYNVGNLSAQVTSTPLN